MMKTLEQRREFDMIKVTTAVHSDVNSPSLINILVCWYFSCLCDLSNIRPVTGG